MIFTYKDAIISITEDKIVIANDRLEYIIYEEKYVNKPWSFSKLYELIELIYKEYFTKED